MLVYISRRYDQSITEAYAATDTWRKHEFDRRERLDDPEATVRGLAELGPVLDALADERLASRLGTRAAQDAR